MAINTIQAKLRFTGAYVCPHLSLQQAPSRTPKPRKCCGGGAQDEWVPVCSLINGLCPGLVNCPRLDVKTKSELIQRWREDLKANRPVDTSKLVK